MNKWNLTPVLTSVILLILTVVLAFQLLQTLQEKRALEETLKTLETGFEAERQAKQQQFDSLQQEIKAQETQQQELEESLQQLQQHKNQLRTSYEKKRNALARIRSADSLRDAIARRYR